MNYTIYTDGGSRGNPGPAAYGYVITNSNGENIFEEGGYIGVATNNFAEYTAVLKSLKKVLELHKAEDTTVEMYMDSEVVKRQLTGEYRVKNPVLNSLYSEVKRMEAKLKSIDYNHVRRHLNQKADALVNKALDSLQQL